MQLRRVKTMPKDLRAGILYYAEEYGAAAHLCACGCGAKVRTPIDQTEWSIEEDEDGPSLYPSVGNWQKACRSHYFIRNGQILWCETWTESEIEAGRQSECERRTTYFAKMEKRGRLSVFWDWLKKLFSSL